MKTVLWSADLPGPGAATPIIWEVTGLHQFRRFKLESTGGNLH